MKQVEEIAKKRPGTPSMPAIAQQEHEALLASNKLYLEFVERDCANATFKEGAVGGSAETLSKIQCSTGKIYQRVRTLAKRYAIEISEKKEN